MIDVAGSCVAGSRTSPRLGGDPRLDLTEERVAPACGRQSDTH